MNDPLRYGICLPLERTLYPLGFPARFFTNSYSVVEAVEESWADYAAEFDDAPFEIRVMAGEDESAPFAGVPAYRGLGHLLSIVADPANQAVVDFDRGYAWCHLSSKTVADRAWMRYHFLEGIVYSTLTYRHFTPIHAACVERNGHAVLLCGTSGAGKSTLAFACARSGWRYLTDDASMILRRAGEPVIIGKPHNIRFRENAGEALSELRGLPATRSPSGKLTIEVRTANIPGITIASRARVSAAVFLNRNGESPARLTPVDKTEAFVRLREAIPLTSPWVMQEHERILQQLMECEMLEVRYRDAGDALRILEQRFG